MKSFCLIQKFQGRVYRCYVCRRSVSVPSFNELNKFDWGWLCHEINLVNKLSKERGGFPAIYLCINIWIGHEISVYWVFERCTSVRIKISIRNIPFTMFCREQIRFMSLLLDFPHRIDIGYGYIFPISIDNGNWSMCLQPLLLYFDTEVNGNWFLCVNTVPDEITRWQIREGCWFLNNLFKNWHIDMKPPSPTHQTIYHNRTR